MACDYAPPAHTASAALASVNGGCLLGAAMVAAVRGSMSSSEMMEWGWRVPFLVGILFGGVGVWLRRGLGDTHGFEQMSLDKKLAESPVKMVRRGGEGRGGVLMYGVREAGPA